MGTGIINGMWFAFIGWFLVNAASQSYQQVVIGDMLEEELETLTACEDAMDAFRKLAKREMRQIPVVQDGELVGMLRRRDILRWLRVRSEMVGS